MTGYSIWNWSGSIESRTSERGFRDNPDEGIETFGDKNDPPRSLGSFRLDTAEYESLGVKRPD